MKDLLLTLVGSPVNFDLSTIKGERLEACVLLLIDRDEAVSIRSLGTNYTVDISSIYSIEFPGFHKYKSVCSKIFTID